jgi:hypothetical protein
LFEIVVNVGKEKRAIVAHPLRKDSSIEKHVSTAHSVCPQHERAFLHDNSVKSGNIKPSSLILSRIFSAPI